MSLIQSQFDQVYDRIRQAEQSCHREGQVQLLAVSKTKPAAVVREAWRLGHRHFGENYLQEALDKMNALTDLKDIHWHFIGPIQSNKARDIATHFHWVHSVDRLKVAKRLSDQRSEASVPLNLCLQVNISGEQSKSGVALDELSELVANVSVLPNLVLRGLMAIPAPEPDPVKQRMPFRQMAKTLKQLNDTHGLSMDTLSMGMTGDLDTAIQEGATLIRVGTALFGARTKRLS